MGQMLSSKVKYGLGKLIGYYRNKAFKLSNDGSYKQEIFIQANIDYPFDEVMDGENVCSISTFRRMENGEPIKNDDLYEYFIDKLGFEFDYRFELLDFQEAIGERLYHAVEMYDCEMMKDIKEEILSMYKGFEDYFYFREYYEAYMLILNYNLDYIHPSKTECYEWLKKYDVLDEKTQEMVLIVLLMKLYSRELDIKIGIEICELLSEINQKGYMKVPFVSGVLRRETNRLTLLNNLNEAIKYYDNVESDYFSGFCRYTRLGILQFIDNGEIGKEFSIIENYFLKCDGHLVRRKIINLYHFAGFYYYNNDDLKNALYYFEKYLDNTEGVDVPKVFHIMDCLIESDVENWKEILKNHPVNKNNDLVALQEYYSLRLNSEDYFKMQEHILEEVIPCLQKYNVSNRIITFFSKEMIRFSKVTKKYKGFSALIDLINEIN